MKKDVLNGQVLQMKKNDLVLALLEPSKLEAASWDGLARRLMSWNRVSWSVGGL